jgi:MFS family permease
VSAAVPTPRPGEAEGAGGTAGAPTGAVPLRRHRDFRRYWIAREVSIGGTLVTAVALPVLVYRLSGSPSLTALITVVEGLPYLMLGLFSGALSDRLDRRRVMVVADVVAALVIASVPLAWWLGTLTPWHALAAGFLSQAAFVFFDGAAFGALPAIVGRDRIGEANSAVWGVGSLLDLGIPMLAGLLLAFVHPAWLLGLDALSFALSAACVAGIRTRLSEQRTGRPPLRPRVLVAEVAEGLRFLWQHRGVRSQTVVGFLLSLSGAGFMSLSVPYADRLLGVGTSGWRFGLVFAAWGVGGILVAVLTPRLLRVFTPNRLALLWLPVAGVSGVVVAMTSTWQVAVAVMVVWGVSYQGVVLNSMTYRQQVTPEPLLGRVNTAGRMLSFGVGWTGGALGASALAGLIGLREALVAVVSVGLVAAVYGWLSPLRTIDRESGPPPGGPGPRTSGRAGPGGPTGEWPGVRGTSIEAESRG